VDGTPFSFTSFDEDLVVSGVTYKSTVGFSRSAVQTGSTGQVDNLDVLGYFSDDGIVEEDLKNGLYDYATIYLFAVNWANLSQGICRLRRGWLGQCIRSPVGAFEAELRGLTQALVQEFGNAYQPLCRADLGDAKCGMPIVPPLWQPGAVYQQGAYVRAATQSTDALLVAIFQAQNAGNTGSEPTWNPTIGAITIDTNGVNPVHWESMPYWRGLAAVATPISQHTFISPGLNVPAAGGTSSNSAFVQFRGNVSANTHVTISDGAGGEIGFICFFDAKLKDAWAQFQATIINAVAVHIPNMSVTFPVQYTAVLTNLSGGPGSIIKTGDTLGSIVIQDFTASIFSGAAVTWISGQNNGVTMEMKAYDAGSGTVTLWLGAKYGIQAGDRFLYYPSCDKRRDTCRTRFNNILNNRSEPDMPGMDAVLSYPDTPS
jgi:hypothetical protein